MQGVDAQIAAVAGNKVRDLQKVVDDLTQKISKISTEMSKLKVAINTSIRYVVLICMVNTNMIYRQIKEILS